MQDRTETARRKEGVRRLLKWHRSDNMVVSTTAVVKWTGRVSLKGIRGKINRTLLNVVIQEKAGTHDDILIPGLEYGVNYGGFHLLGKFNRQSRFGGRMNLIWGVLSLKCQWNMSVEMSIRHLNPQNQKLRKVIWAKDIDSLTVLLWNITHIQKRR